MKERGSPVLFYTSLNRPFQVLGVNQHLFYGLLPLWVPLAIAWGFHPIALGVSAFLGVLCHTIGVLLTRLDSQILDVYNRHRRYQGHYTTVSGIHAKVPPVKLSVPYYQGKTGVV